MPHYTESQITAANQTDLVAFLMSRGEKLKPCGNQYLWERHQVWIHGYEWYTHYDSKGGYAVSFVMRYYGLTFQNTIAELLSESVSEILPAKYQPKPIKVLNIPQPNAIINNGPKEKEEKTSEKGGKSSIMDRLKAAKSEPHQDKPTPHKERKNDREL